MDLACTSVILTALIGASLDDRWRSSIGEEILPCSFLGVRPNTSHHPNNRFV